MARPSDPSEDLEDLEDLKKHLKQSSQKHLPKSSWTHLHEVWHRQLGVNPSTQTPCLLLGMFLCLGPLFLVTVRGWSNGILIIGAFLCLVFLTAGRHRLHEKNGQRINSEGTLLARGMTLTLLSPFIAVAISSALRHSLYLPQFDSPVRFCLAVPVFIFALRTKFNAAKFLQFAVPAALLITLGQQYLITQPMHWGTTRMATYFADPLVFGYVSMTFGLVSAVSINLLKKDAPLIVAFKLIGAVTGFYLSIQSGSRTGWMVIPIVLGIWAYQHTSGNGSKRTQVFVVVALSCLISVLTYFTSSTVHPRVDLIANEIATYPWTGIAPETAVGSRITFLRIAWDLFFQNPWGGFGDTRFEQFPLPPNIQGYASATTLDTAFRSGFHNEIVTNAIRSGIFGLLAYAALFIVPLTVFVKKLKSEVAFSKANAVIGTTFVMSMFVSSLSTEILDLKYMASFYALTIALLCGCTLARHEQN